MDDLQIEFLHQRSQECANWTLPATQTPIEEGHMRDGLPAGNDPRETGIADRHEPTDWHRFKMQRIDGPQRGPQILLAAHVIVERPPPHFDEPCPQPIDDCRREFQRSKGYWLMFMPAGFHWYVTCPNNGHGPTDIERKRNRMVA